MDQRAIFWHADTQIFQHRLLKIGFYSSLMPLHLYCKSVVELFCTVHVDSLTYLSNLLPISYFLCYNHFNITDAQSSSVNPPLFFFSFFKVFLLFQVRGQEFFFSVVGYLVNILEFMAYNFFDKYSILQLDSTLAL